MRSDRTATERAEEIRRTLAHGDILADVLAAETPREREDAAFAAQQSHDCRFEILELRSHSTAETWEGATLAVRTHLTTDGEAGPFMILDRETGHKWIIEYVHELDDSYAGALASRKAPA